MWYKTNRKTMKMLLGIFSGFVQMVALVPFKEFFNICYQENFDSRLLSPITTNSLRTYICTYVVCMYVCMCVCMYACMHVCMYVGTNVCTYVCMYACMHACLYVCRYKCM